MQDLSMNGYTREEVVAVLTGPSRHWSFRYHLLNEFNQYLRTLHNVTRCSVEYNALADVKGRATFLLEEGDQINFQKDRIQPWVRLRMPSSGGRVGYVEWPQGVYIPATPVRYTTPGGRVMREVEGYDQGLVLRDDIYAEREHIEAGTRYTDAAYSIANLGVPLIDVTHSDLELPVDREWPPGTPRSQVVQDLLTAINYAPLHFNGHGIGIMRPYVSPADTPSAYIYADDEASVTLPGVEQERDLFSVANRWVLVTSAPELPPLRAEWLNVAWESPTSIPSRGRIITDFREAEGEAPSQAVLDARVQRLAFEASQVYEAVEFETGLMPFHEHADVYSLFFPLFEGGTWADLANTWTGLGGGVGGTWAEIFSGRFSAKYSEHRWSVELKAGAKMKHRARRVVAI